MTEIRAAGFVLHRVEQGRFLYLTLENARHGDFGAPKGHAHEGEDSLATALRETEEETGLRPRPHAHFRRTARYPVAQGTKVVDYFVARTESDVRLSEEHRAAYWEDLDATCARLRHDVLRSIYTDTAIFLKDPILRRGLSPAAARALLEREVGSDAPVVAHTAEVAAMARALAETRGDVDADFVEATAWLHDLGRARTHGPRHPIEGFRLAVAAGHPGYAPACLSHFTKGRPIDALDLEAGLAHEMAEACDLERFDTEERLVALADAMAAGDARGTIAARYADLRARYGASAFLDANEAASEALREEFEAATGRPLYPLLGIE